MNDSLDNDPSPDLAAEHALRKGLEAKVLSPEALRRIRQAAEQEWRSTTHVPARSRWRPLATAASVIVLAAGIVGGYLAIGPTSGEGAILGKLASFDAPGITETHRFRRGVLLAEGATLRVGHTLEVRGDSLVTLSGGGNLRVARASVIKVESEDSISLEQGELYVDIPPGTKVSGAFHVVTDAGEFRHEGTQFAVAIVAGQTRLRVREGRVLWRAKAGESTVDAGTEVVIEKSGKARHRSIATAGRSWAWIESLTPAATIEDRPLIEFLEWYARQTGRKLVIDDAARRQAAGIRMHGNVRGLTMSEALSAVMATTRLRYELPEGVIRVSSASETKTPPV